ncbi:MAG: hypothetical protein CMH13_18405 [Martelella sp.]|nr:hypothetical protein [Martelella sp.]
MIGSRSSLLIDIKPPIVPDERIPVNPMCFGGGFPGPPAGQRPGRFPPAADGSRVIVKLCEESAVISRAAST